MSATTELRNQLQSLSIAKEQRPRAGRAARGKSRIGTVLVLVVLAGAGAGVYLYRDRIFPVVTQAVAQATQKVADVPTITVRAQADNAAPPTLTATGKVVSDHRVEVATKVSGQVVELLFEQGDAVKAGQLLARIEKTNYQARRDESAAMLEKARANLDYYTYNYERIQRLHQGTDASDIELIDAKRWYEDAKSAVAAEEARLQYAEKLLSDCDVVAPIGGVILERNVEVGDFVAAEGGRGANANAQFAAIADMGKLRVEVDVSELDIARVRGDMPCVITPDAYKTRKYSGHVLWIDPGANYAKATVQVKVRIDDPDEYLRVEGSAQVQFMTESATSAASASQPTPTIWIPAAACAVDEAGKTGFVYVVRDGALAKATITIGRRSGGQIEVFSGLKDGDLIAASGLEQLSEGMRIKTQ
ncbi:MAG: efflux RND transporter periplasmic adaptor subunit [Phycisphaerae bacterium]